eukprot:8263469-Pyramimonas_sp.AAC.1
MGCREGAYTRTRNQWRVWRGNISQAGTRNWLLQTQIPEYSQVGTRDWLLQFDKSCSISKMFGPTCSHARWLYEWATALFTTGLVTAATADRCTLGGLMIIAMALAGWVDII